MDCSLAVVVALAQNDVAAGSHTLSVVRDDCKRPVFLQRSMAEGPLIVAGLWYAILAVIGPSHPDAVWDRDDNVLLKPVAGESKEFMPVGCDVLACT